MKHIAIAFLGLIVSISCVTRTLSSQDHSDSQEVIVLYPGKFDPFHETHAEEVKTALKELRPKKILVAPVVKAYYFPKLPDTAITTPSLLNFDWRQKFIEAQIEDRRVKVIPELKSIERSIFDSISQTQTAYSVSHVLIGQDVLEKWSRLPGFESFLKNIELVVTSDNSDIEVFRHLKKLHSNNSKIQFMEIDEGSSTRSGALRESLLKGKSIEGHLAGGSKFFNQNRSELYAIAADFSKRVLGYLEEAASTELKPLLREKIEPVLFSFIEKSPLLSEFVRTRNMTLGENVGELTSMAYEQAPFKNLPNHLRLNFTRSAIKNFYNAEVYAFYEKNRYFFELSAIIREAKNQKLDKKAFSNRLIHFSGLASKFDGKFFRFVQKRISAPLQSLFSPFLQFRMPILDCKNKPLNDSDSKIMIPLYRGIAFKKDLEKKAKKLEGNWFS